MDRRRQTTTVILIGLALVGCTGRANLDPGVPSPRTWDEADFRAPEEAEVAEGVNAIPWERYLDDGEVWQEERGIAVPVHRWRAIGDAYSAVRLYIDAEDVWEGIGDEGENVAVRESIWPTGGNIIRRTEDAVELATEWVGASGFSGEVRCAARSDAAEARVRLFARVVRDLNEAEIALFAQADDGSACEVNERMMDRVRTFSIDVVMKLRAARRRGVAIPFRW